MSIDPPGGGSPKPPGSASPGVERPEEIRRPDEPRTDFAQQVEGSEASASASAAAPPAEAPPGLERVREIARALETGEIATRDEALTHAAEAMLTSRLAGVPRADLERAAAEIGRLAREDPVLREHVGRLLDRLGRSSDE